MAAAIVNHGSTDIEGAPMCTLIKRHKGRRTLRMSKESAIVSGTTVFAGEVNTDISKL